MATIDIVIIALVCILAVVGFYKGFIKSFVALVGFVFSMVLAILLAKIVANALLDVDGIGKIVAGDKSLYSWLFSKMPKSLEGISSEEIRNAANVKALFDAEAPWFLRAFYPLIAPSLNNPVYLDTLNNARQIMALELAYGIYVIIVDILLFIVFRIIAAIIGMIFKKNITGRKSVGGRFIGAIFGATKAVMYAILILALFSFMANFSFMKSVNKEIEKSEYAKELSNVSVKVSAWMLEDKEDNKRFERLVKLTGITAVEDTDEEEAGEEAGEDNNDENGGENQD